MAQELRDELDTQNGHEIDRRIREGEWSLGNRSFVQRLVERGRADILRSVLQAAAEVKREDLFFLLDCVLAAIARDGPAMAEEVWKRLTPLQLEELFETAHREHRSLFFHEGAFRWKPFLHTAAAALRRVRDRRTAAEQAAVLQARQELLEAAVQCDDAPLLSALASRANILQPNVLVQAHRWQATACLQKLQQLGVPEQPLQRYEAAIQKIDTETQ